MWTAEPLINICAPRDMTPIIDLELLSIAGHVQHAAAMLAAMTKSNSGANTDF